MKGRLELWHVLTCPLSWLFKAPRLCMFICHEKYLRRVRRDQIRKWKETFKTYLWKTSDSVPEFALSYRHWFCYCLGQPLKWEFWCTECMPAGCTPVCPQVKLCLSVPLKTLQEMWCGAVQSSLSAMNWNCNWPIYEILNKPLVSPSRLTTSLSICAWSYLCGNVIGSGLLRAKKPKGELTGDSIKKPMLKWINTLDLIKLIN